MLPPRVARLGDTPSLAAWDSAKAKEPGLGFDEMRRRRVQSPMEPPPPNRHRLPMVMNGDLAPRRSSLSQCSSRGYIASMRAAGVREIKNKLSEYLRIVATGETVLVTDHGRVIAQLGPPPAHTPPALSEDESLERLAASGKIRLPRGKVPSPGAGPVEGVPRGIDLEGILSDVRARRHDG